jgi:N-acetylglucosaminyl-diphospho-decaprenol L-rhamnosyltransferase
MSLISTVVVAFDPQESHRSLLVGTVIAVRGFSALVVVDNGPWRDGHEIVLPEALRLAGQRVVCVPFAPDRGFGEACNAGASVTPFARAILLVNPDAEITRDTVERLLRALDRWPRLGIVSAWLVKHDGRPAESGGRFPSISELVLGKLAWVQRRTPVHTTSTPHGDGHHGVVMVDWVSGAVMMIRREAWDAVGGFDPAFFLYYEDIDLCRRVRAAGWEVGIVPGATAIHESGGSQWRPGTRTRVERIYFESQAYYFRKHYGRLMEWLLRAVRFPYLATSLRRRFLERHGVRIRVASGPA